METFYGINEKDKKHNKSETHYSLKEMETHPAAPVSEGKDSRSETHYSLKEMETSQLNTLRTVIS